MGALDNITLYRYGEVLISVSHHKYTIETQRRIDDCETNLVASFTPDSLNGNPFDTVNQEEVPSILAKIGFDLSTSYNTIEKSDRAYTTVFYEQQQPITTAIPSEDAGHSSSFHKYKQLREYKGVPVMRVLEITQSVLPDVSLPERDCEHCGFAPICNMDFKL